jgi:large subunit ribosomal protein L21
MYAVIKTGGKQYRVQAGDLLVVEKLDGQPGAEIAFDQVLMLGDAGEVTVGAPLVDGAVVRATLIETRKGEKVKIFKKIRRQGYRRTRGHRQPESVLRVVGLEGAGKSARWDGTVDLTPRSELVLRARGLAKGPRGAAPDTASEDVTPAGVEVETVVSGVEPNVQATIVEHAGPVAGPEAEAAAAPKKTRARKPKTDDAAPEGGEA